MINTQLLFREDAYLTECQATIMKVNETDGMVIDKTVFYPAGGGQPGDAGQFECNGKVVNIATTIKDKQTGELIHIVAEGEAPFQVGDKVIASIDWATRYLHMRMHSALHLLCAVVPCGVTGGQISALKSRLDFDIGESTLDKAQISLALKQLVAENHPVSSLWITEQALEQNPELVRTMSVQPPRGAGKIRLLKVGEAVDLQPCGGTHVKETGEIGSIGVSKIENKGKRNRRVHIVFED